MRALCLTTSARVLMLFVVLQVSVDAAVLSKQLEHEHFGRLIQAWEMFDIDANAIHSKIQINRRRSIASDEALLTISIPMANEKFDLVLFRSDAAFASDFTVEVVTANGRELGHVDLHQFYRGHLKDKPHST